MAAKTEEQSAGISRRDLLRAAGVMAAGIGLNSLGCDVKSSTGAAPAAGRASRLKRQNVLFIPVDDLRPQLYCYGRHQMVTPNIDRLAADGIIFTQAYCQVPVCGASRASLLTGVRPNRNRFVNYRTWADRDLPGAVTLPQHFRQHGYSTSSVGKVFHHRPDTAERSWSRGSWRPAVSGGGGWRNYLLEENIRISQENDGRGPPFELTDVPDDAYFDGQIADKGIEELNQLCKEDNPFFLAVGFSKPHLPFNAPNRYWDLYKSDDINLATNPFRPSGAPDEAMHNWGELREYFNVPRKGPLPDGMDRQLVHGYYAATSYMDAQVGRLLKELDRLGLRDNTIVVLWGDHGWQLGEHSLWCKHCNFDTSLNAPLIVSAPDITGEKQSAALVEFVDIYPTLCELSGLPMPDHLEGTSFVPLMEDSKRPWKTAAFSRYHAGDSIRTGQHLYTEWTDDQGNATARMLYDHKVDPDENANVAELAENARLVHQFSERLRQGWEAVRP